MRRPAIALLLLLGAITSACKDDGPSRDTGGGQPDGARDGPTARDGRPGDGGPADFAGAIDGHWVPAEAGKGCPTCLLEQICVHFVTQSMCKVTHSQCKYRTPSCFSSTVNPCCVCEQNVCGLWYTCKPTTCTKVPGDASVDPAKECFCYSK